MQLSRCVIPENAPFSNGIDPAIFAGHYASAYADRNLRIRQRVFSFWYFWFAPFVLGMLPGSLIADRLYSGAGNEAMWLVVAAVPALAITPALMWWRRRHSAHKRFSVFYGAALERCIKNANAAPATVRVARKA